MPQFGTFSMHGYTTDSSCSQHFSSFSIEQLHELQQCIDSAVQQAFRDYSSGFTKAESTIRQKKSSKAPIQRQKIVVPSCARCKKKFSSRNKLFKHLKSYGHTKKGLSRLNQGSTSSPASQQARISASSSLPYDHSVQTQPIILPQISSLPQYKALPLPCIPRCFSSAPSLPVQPSTPPTQSAQPLTPPSYSPPLYTSTSSATGFRARDIGFFDPDSTKEAIEIRNGCRLYHDVHSFTQRLQAIDTSMLRQNLKICLLGKTDRWYMELSHTARLKLKEGIEQWCKALESQFQPT